MRTAEESLPWQFDAGTPDFKRMREAADFEHGADHTWQAGTAQLAPDAKLEVPALNILQYVFPRRLWLLGQGGMIRMARKTSNIDQA